MKTSATDLANLRAEESSRGALCLIFAILGTCVLKCLVILLYFKALKPFLKALFKADSREHIVILYLFSNFSYLFNSMF